VRKEMFRVFSGALLERIFEQGDESHLKQSSVWLCGLRVQPESCVLR
jgi:hypothetical protein